MRNMESKFYVGVGGLCIFALAGMLLLSGEAHYNKEESILASLMQVGTEPYEIPESTEELEVVMVYEQTEYTGGSVAYVDYNVDMAGECILVWLHDKELFSHCDNVEAGWQTLYERRVPAGTTNHDIMIRWDEEFAPSNWS